MLEDPTTVQILIKARMRRNDFEMRQQRQLLETDSRKRRKEHERPVSSNWKQRFLARIIRH